MFRKPSRFEFGKRGDHMNRLMSAALVVALSTTAIPAVAQEVSAQAPAPAAVSIQPMVLAAGTQIVVANNSEITSTDHREGHMFPLTVAKEVRVGDVVVIPRGTRAMGEITWRTGRGAFGKSGKLNFSIRYLDRTGRAFHSLVISDRTGRETHS